VHSAFYPKARQIEATVLSLSRLNRIYNPTIIIVRPTGWVLLEKRTGIGVSLGVSIRTIPQGQ
jgi:hypothetical protein